MASTPVVTNTRALLSVFEKYQKDRLVFVQTISDLASRESNIEALQSAGVLALLRPLLLDSVPAIQQAAALALGRLANYHEELAQAVVDSDILPQLVFSLSEQNVSSSFLYIIAILQKGSSVRTSRRRKTHAEIGSVCR